MINLEDEVERCHNLIDELREEIAWLSYFYSEADFGPADSDVRDMIMQSYIEEGGKLPSGYAEE